jgi:outer membrane protein TolC
MTALFRRSGFSPLAFLMLLAAPLPLPAEPLPSSLSFAEAARLAVAASVELRDGYAQRAIREGAWGWGRRAYFPKFTLGASEDDRLAEISTDSFMKNLTINVDQLLWDGGRTAMGRRIERAELNLTGAALERMAGEIADGALRAYRNVLLSRAVLEIRESSWKALEEQRRILARELELGIALAQDLGEAEITVAEALLEVRSLRLDLGEAERQLAELLGLEELPPLAERLDIREKGALPPVETLRSLGGSRNPDLVSARYSIAQKQEELKYASRSWMPHIRLNGSFSLSGRNYPLTRYNWSVGLSVDFSSPWFSASTGASLGWEPPYDRSARLQANATPLPDPASALNVPSAKLALALEKTRYQTALEGLDRRAQRAAEQYFLADEQRALAVEALDLGAERLRLGELRMELGRITRIELMETRLDYAKREVSAVEAAAALLETRRELERLLDMGPGELARYIKS